jgi:hypothetical protein
MVGDFSLREILTRMKLPAEAAKLERFFEAPVHMAHGWGR